MQRFFASNPTSPSIASISWPSTSILMTRSLSVMSSCWSTRTARQVTWFACATSTTCVPPRLRRVASDRPKVRSRSLVASCSASIAAVALPFFLGQAQQRVDGPLLPGAGDEDLLVDDVVEVEQEPQPHAVLDRVAAARQARIAIEGDPVETPQNRNPGDAARDGNHSRP